MVKNCSADIGGGIYLKNSPIHFNQLTVEDNYSNKGGGMYCHYSDAVIKNSKVIDNTGVVCGGVYFYHSSAIITNCVISNNMSHAGGGGVVIHKASHANFMNCKIEHNIAVGSGGGVAILEGSLPVFKYCHISYNTTQYQEYQAKGAGFFITSYDNSPVIINCFISGNICGEEGGGFYSESKLQLIDCLISNNVASVSQGFGGGGMYTMFNQNLVLNCTFSGNQAPQGSTIYGAGSMTEMYNTIIWDDTIQTPFKIFLHNFMITPGLKINYSDIQDGTASISGSGSYNLIWGEGNIWENPKFDDKYQLLEGSPCIDAGLLDTLALILPSKDLNGNSRIVNDTIDMGCYEYQYGVFTPLILSEETIKMTVYPNPAREYLIVGLSGFDGVDLCLSLISLDGKIIYRDKITLTRGSFDYRMDIYKVPPGLYVLQLQNENQNEVRKVIIIK